MITQADTADAKTVFRPGDKIIFQGDSITDADRGEENAPDAGLGHGYVYLIAARLCADYSDCRLSFRNRGISGNKIDDLTARWERDALALQPDILSILIGINDSAAEMPVSEFEAAYNELLAGTKATLPHIRLILCEPFALAPQEPDGRWHGLEENVRQRARIVENLATEYGAPFVRFQELFDDACKPAPADHWLYDGIHPTHAGHQIMADEWIRAAVSTLSP